MITRIIFLSSLFAILIGETVGSSTCGLHILDDAETSVGTQLFHFLIFPHNPSDNIVLPPCDLQPNSQRSLDFQGIFTKVKDCLPDVSLKRLVWLLSVLQSTIFVYHMFIVTSVYLIIRTIARKWTLPTRNQHTCSEGVQSKMAGCSFVKSGHRKFITHGGNEKQDSLKYLKLQRTKLFNLPKQIYLYIKKYGFETNIKFRGHIRQGNETDSHIQPAFESKQSCRHRKRLNKIPPNVFKELIASVECQKKTNFRKDKNVSKARQEMRNTLTSSAQAEVFGATMQDLLTHPVVQGGGDFVSETGIHIIGHPRASSSFISTGSDEDDVGTTSTLVVEDTSDRVDNLPGFIDNKGGHSHKTQNDDRAATISALFGTDDSQSCRQDNRVMYTHQSMADGETDEGNLSQTPTMWNYLPDLTYDNISTSSGADQSLNDNGNLGDESSLASSMLDSIASVSDHLQKSSTFYGSEDMETTVYQLVSLAVVTKKLAYKAWMYLFSRGRQTSPSEESTQEQASRNQYYPNFDSESHDESDLLRYEMVD